MRIPSLTSRTSRAALAALCGVAGLAAAATGAAWWDVMRDLPSASAVAKIDNGSQATIVYDAADQPATTLFRENRLAVPLSRVSPHFIRALIAIEDRRFFLHGAVDPPRIVSAALINLTHWRVEQGASTLTQQLARIGFLTATKTVRRKLQELVLAWRIERQYTKPQILELYVNRVYFGNGSWGVESASLGYFGKHASDLTLPEAAMLAGLVKAPTTYAPTGDLDKAIRRRNTVLQAMLDSRAIDRKTWEQSVHAECILKDATAGHDGQGEYFFEEVRKSLVDQFGADQVYAGGLRVHSTIDTPTQKAAEAAVAASLATLDRRHAASQHPAQEAALQAALIAIDPRTGYVRALVGGRQFAASQFDRAMQARRQPGSAFKPFVYAAALEAGYTEASVIDRLDEPIEISGPEDWVPKDEHVDASSLDLRSALKVSSNRAAIRLLQQVGIPRVVKYAGAFGLGDLPAVPSLALGSGEVTLAALTSAYAAFANGGWVRKPVLIRQVDDGSGKVLMAAPDEPSRAITEVTAFLMSDMLADVVNAGTAAQVRALGFTRPAAGKTGTTNDFNDAWFVGYTPELVVGVWVGFDAPHTIAPRGFAASIAVPLWTRFMMAAPRGDGPAWFTPPAGIVRADVCLESGALATNDCPDHRISYFARGTQPAGYCELHRPSLLRRIFGFAEARRPQPYPIASERVPVDTFTPDETSTPRDQPAPRDATETPRQKSDTGSFWSRLLHRGPR